MSVRCQKRPVEPTCNLAELDEATIGSAVPDAISTGDSRELVTERSSRGAEGAIWNDHSRDKLPQTREIKYLRDSPLNTAKLPSSRCFGQVAAIARRMEQPVALVERQIE